MISPWTTVQQIHHDQCCQASQLYFWLLDCSKWRSYVACHPDIIVTGDAQFTWHCDALLPASHQYTNCGHVVVAEYGCNPCSEQAGQRGLSSGNVFLMCSLIARSDNYQRFLEWHTGRCPRHRTPQPS